ncbi:GNAT family N-acetyltransferase [Kitasatospora phosalacinea]|uniref:GNAT family N-acetyltransferase n=1 Tax=Kitasatospora phosalacinea TaxID=2065 RepID=UPI0025552EC3|nr:GNAT family N-acetyltransferase [Kitasatospora phosalacinea]
MTTVTTGPAMGLSVRPYEAADQDAVLALVNADRLTGQPESTASMLADALAGKSQVDAGWWEELDAPSTDIVHDASGRVLGVISYAVRSSDGTGLLLWLHCREDQAIASALITHVVRELGDRMILAFEFASALTLGLEGLPVGHRPETRQALELAGFSGRNLWRYMHSPLPIAGLPHTASYTVSECEEPPGKQLEIRGDNGELMAEATIGRPVAGIGVLWWISVTPAHRGRGLGPALMGSCLDLLAGLGASEVILFVDDDAPADDVERSRAAANLMYDRAGLVEVDRLWSFSRRP